jgi:hypothetical protein
MKQLLVGKFTIDRLALLGALICSIIIVFYPISDPDMYWHLANGREMVNTGRIVSEEIFSYTHQGAKFDNHEWLGQIIFYLIWNDLGPYWLFGFKLLVTSLVVWYLYRTIRNIGGQAVFAAVLCAFAVLVGIHRYIERPELFSLLNTSLLCYILYGFRSNQPSRHLFWFVPLMLVVWDWLHGAVYGLALFSLFVAGENLKYFAPLLRNAGSLPRKNLKFLNQCFAASMLAMLANPLGLRTYGIFIALSQEMGGNSKTGEFQPSSWSQFPGLYLLIGWVTLLILRNIRKLDITYLLLLICFGYLALRYNRASAYAAIVLVPIIASLTVTSLQNIKNKFERIAYFSITALSAAFVLGYGYSIKFNAEWDPFPRDFGYQVLEDGYYPAGSVRFIKAVGLTGNLYNNGDDGGFLSYYLTPERKIFRYNMPIFGDPFYIFSHPEEVEKWNFNYAIIKYPSEVRFMFPKKDWAWIYHEHRSLLVLRRSPENLDLINQYEIRYFSPSISNQVFISMARDPKILQRLVFEMGVYLAYCEDDRIAGIWAKLLAANPAMMDQPRFKQLLQQVRKYNKADILTQLDNR